MNTLNQTQKNNLKLSNFDYELPKELIAQVPSQKREMSRMMVLDKCLKTVKDEHFFNIIDELTENDLLVMNNTKVIPARIFAQKETGAHIEIFLAKETEPDVWEALIKPSKRVKAGMVLKVSDELSVEALEKDDDSWKIRLLYDGNIYEILEKVGNLPLPPYIERKMTTEDIKKLDTDRYQTVYAKNEGSVAAPTAGLHFTNEIIDKLEKKGVKHCFVNLTVGLGTFKPVKCDNILEHKMHSEAYEISEESARIINEAKKAGKNIVAVGTTSVRTLETAMKKYGEIKAVKDASELFIYPGYEFKIVDKIITNFHLPKSTLLMLVCAFAGKDYIFESYKHAVETEYRFFSYGDCMFIK
ncbi:MAG: tRNA preQ1(34) S-adenosylmethionine ribosyltransferase-isomerase QueA [Candidatus Gastranaerophilales bacterium]|nr:tRNA preQ1(34) S-adenosylmethionine ribosyltransferase-isomerase QueA [Candidatus Gastranaerophilales bacterium]